MSGTDNRTPARRFSRHSRQTGRARPHHPDLRTGTPDARPPGTTASSFPPPSRLRVIDRSAIVYLTSGPAVIGASRRFLGGVLCRTVNEVTSADWGHNA
jgi:hypothetical protein